MTKIVDSNSWWEIKKNPISKVGIFPYLGKSISSECEPDKIYNVYRSADVLKESVPTWDNPPKPFINDHEMLGEGFSKIDDRPVQGVIHNPVFEDDVLYADISVYSESLKDAIANGKKELSLGYTCKYKKEKGVYRGQTYDYVQIDMVGNHIALVDNGRCGNDVKVFDSKCTMDSLDVVNAIEVLKTNAEDDTINITEEKGSEMEKEEKKEVEVKDEELEQKEESKEIVKDEDEEKKSEDKCGKDEEEEKKAEDAESSEIVTLLQSILAEIRSLGGKKATDEEEKAEESKDEDEEKKESEDEDEEKADEEKKAEDSADLTITFAKDSVDTPCSMMDDPALRKYLNI